VKRRLFAVDHNFPEPLLRHVDSILGAELVPIRMIDSAWAELDDWELGSTPERFHRGAEARARTPSRATPFREMRSFADCKHGSLALDPNYRRVPFAVGRLDRDHAGPAAHRAVLDVALVLPSPFVDEDVSRFTAPRTAKIHQTPTRCSTRSRCLSIVFQNSA